MKLMQKYEELIDYLKQLVEYHESFHSINSMKEKTLKEYIKTAESELAALKAEAEKNCNTCANSPENKAILKRCDFCEDYDRWRPKNLQDEREI